MNLGRLFHVIFFLYKTKVQHLLPKVTVRLDDIMCAKHSPGPGWGAETAAGLPVRLLPLSRPVLGLWGAHGPHSGWKYLLLLLPSSSAVNCMPTCLPPGSLCCMSRGAEAHQPQPGVAVGPKGQRCRRPGTPTSRLELRYRLHVPGSFPEGQLPKALPQTLQRDPGPHMPGVCVGWGGFPCSKDALGLPLAHVSCCSKE